MRVAGERPRMMMDQSVNNNRIASPSLSDVAEKLTHVERLGQTHLLHSFDSAKHKTVYLDGTVHFRSKMRAGEHLWPDIVERRLHVNRLISTVCI